MKRMGYRIGAYRDFVGTAEGIRPFGRPRGRRKDNIKIYQREAEWGDMDWIVVDQVARACECCNEHPVSVKYGDILTG
jgi:hypothetical protein